MRVLDATRDRETVLARFVSGLSPADERLLRRMLGGQPDRERLRRPECTSSLYLPLVVPLLAAVTARRRPNGCRRGPRPGC